MSEHKHYSQIPLRQAGEGILFLENLTKCIMTVLHATASSSSLQVSGKHLGRRFVFETPSLQIIQVAGKQSQVAL